MTFRLNPNIITTKFISQLIDFAKKLKWVIKSILYSYIYPTKSNYQTIKDLGTKLFKTIIKLLIEIKALKKRYTESAYKEGKQQLNQA